MKNEPRKFPLVELAVTTFTAAVFTAALSSGIQRGAGTSDTARCLGNLRRIGQAMAAYAQDNDGYYPLNRQATSGGTTTWRRTLQPYTKDYGTWFCPAVVNFWPKNSQFPGTFGDDSNALPDYKGSSTKWIPASYALSAGWFYTGSTVRPRNASEITDPSHLLMVINSRMALPDLGPWMINARVDLNGNQSTRSNYGPFVAHEGRIPCLLGDGRAASLKLEQTVTPVDMWRTEGYTQTQLQALVTQAAPEYR